MYTILAIATILVNNEDFRSVFNGLVGNACTGVLSKLGIKVGQALPLGLRKVYDHAACIVDAAARHADGLVPPSCDAKAVHRAITRPEVMTMVKEIHSVKLMDRNADVEFVQKHFIRHMAKQLKESEQAVSDLANTLFDALVAACCSELSERREVKQVYDLPANARDTAIYNLVQGLRAQILSAAGGGVSTAEQEQHIRKFEADFRQWLTQRNWDFLPMHRGPYAEFYERVPIEQLYVDPRFQELPRRKDETARTIGMPEFLKGVHRTVLLGIPGGGKTILTRKLCRDLSQDSEGRIGGRVYTPVPVSLGEYAAGNKRNYWSFAQYIALWINGHYGHTPPYEAVDQLLRQGRLLVIFDGLDEIVDVKVRKTVRHDIEWFCQTYGNTPVLITSREVGYSEAPLSREVFSVYRLLPFDEPQIREYAVRWFELEPDPMLTLDQKRQRAERFIAAVSNTDLKSVPLLLALACIIFGDELSLPRKQLDMYRECVRLLLRTHERRKNLVEVESALDNALRQEFYPILEPAIGYLAHWIYTRSKAGNIIDENQVVSVIRDFLTQRGYAGDPETAAQYFVEMCSTRAWVFTEASVPGARPRQFQFTHASFLEYFTALHLVRRYRSPHELGRVLHPHIADGEWSLVAQLAYQAKEAGDEEFGREVILELLQYASRQTPERRTNLLSFAAKALEFLDSVNLDTVDAVVKACTEDWLAVSSHTHSLHRREAFGHLLCVPEWRREKVARCLEHYLLGRIEMGPDEAAIRALEVGFHLTATLIGLKSERAIEVGTSQFWFARSRQIMDKAEQFVDSLGQLSVGVCVDAYWMGKLSLRVLIERHGLKALFADVRYRMFPDRTFSSPAKWIIFDASACDPQAPHSEHRYAMAMAKLQAVADVLPHCPRPWLISGPEDPRSFLEILEELEHLDRAFLPDSQELTPDERFGMFLLSAALIELSAEEELKRIMSWLRGNRVPALDIICWFLLARFESGALDSTKFDLLLGTCGFDEGQAAMVRGWVEQHISFAVPAQRYASAVGE